MGSGAACLVYLSWLLVLAPPARGEERPPLIPQPRQVVWTGTYFPVDDDLQAYVLPDTGLRARAAADMLVDVLLDMGAVNVGWKTGEPPADSRPCIVFSLKDSDWPSASPEAYHLEVSAERVELMAPTVTGLVRGVATLRQLGLPGRGERALAGCTITDWPAFAVRGVMLDVGRQFVSLATIMRFVDQMAYCKLNTFHLHLTEDIGWRLEIKSHPELTAPQHQQRNQGCYYTQDEIRELLDHCRNRQVTVIPEIDMPGHSAAFERATGHPMQSKEGMRILREVFDEVGSLFDGPFIHLGSDDARVTEKTFIPTMAAVVRGNGQNVVLWRPGFSFDRAAIYQLRDKAERRSGERVIDSRDTDLNHLDWFSGVVRIFHKELCRAGEGTEDLLGGVLCLWNERRVAQEEDLFHMNPVIPVMLAFAERSWRGGGYPAFTSVLAPVNSPAFTDFVEFEERLLAHRERHHLKSPFAYVRQTGIVWRVWGPFPNGGDLARSFPPEGESHDSYEVAGKKYRAIEVRGATLFFGGWLDQGLFGPLENHTAYAMTWAHLEEDRKAHMWVGFRGPSRSQPDDTPQEGAWDHRQSRIWLNGEPIPAPLWAKPGRRGDLEDPLIDEGYAYRHPTPVMLKAGWNKILIKAPVGKDPINWMATAILVNWDGARVRELAGVRYSTRPE
ncbi:MAG: family 20 glycosylhydrolase [Planctomycetota bacterium]